MYPNVPKKMRKNDFKLTSCPKPAVLFAKCIGLTVPSFPSGQTAVVDVDPVVALNRVTEDDYNQYSQSVNQSELAELDQSGK